MKFQSSILLAFLSSSNAFISPSSISTTTPRRQHHTASSSTCVAATTSSSSEQETTTTLKPPKKQMVNHSPKKQERLRMMKSPTFHRRGFASVRPEVESTLTSEYQSTLVNDLKSDPQHVLTHPSGVTVHLAKDFGFCWGVERSIALAYEAAKFYDAANEKGDGGRTVHLTNELIHNPQVNDKLKDMGVEFIEKKGGGVKDFGTVKDGDVVVLPAFGASFEEMDLFDKKNVDVVDTTCPWVSKVWNTVDKHQKAGLTSIIHGKYGHEETIATTSFCEDYICVKNMDEAQMVADYIINGGDKEAFLKYFAKAVSKGFDPDTMLKNVGLANQTTMYKKETRAIGKLLQRTMMEKYGPKDLGEHYMEFDTICDATQERQDAVTELVENASSLNLDFILVIGGWDSSNTAHLLEIPMHAGVRSFHINRADCIKADNTITHRTVNGDIVTEKFILGLEEAQNKEVVMGVTSGASTPDSAVQDALGTIFMLKELYGKED